MMLVVYYIITVILTKELVTSVVYISLNLHSTLVSLVRISTTRILKAMTGQGIIGLLMVLPGYIVGWVIL